VAVTLGALAATSASAEVRIAGERCGTAVLAAPVSGTAAPDATFATGGFPASETPRKLGYCDVKLGRQSTT